MKKLLAALVLPSAALLAWASTPARVAPQAPAEHALPHCPSCGAELPPPHRRRPPPDAREHPPLPPLFGRFAPPRGPRPAHTGDDTDHEK